VGRRIPRREAGHRVVVPWGDPLSRAVRGRDGSRLLVGDERLLLLSKARPVAAPAAVPAGEGAPGWVPGKDKDPLATFEWTPSMGCRCWARANCRQQAAAAASRQGVVPGRWRCHLCCFLCRHRRACCDGCWKTWSPHQRYRCSGQRT
jgi:hypothetical protein